MGNKLISEEVKRFNEILKYDPAHILNESEGKISDDIIEKLEPSLPLNKTTSDLESIILLQKTLVDLGKLNKSYGINSDGVDGDFGGDTQKALESTISDTSLTKGNINKFKDFLEENKDKVKNTISDYNEFMETFEEQAGVTKEMYDECMDETIYKKDREIPFRPKRRTCTSEEDMAKGIVKMFPDKDSYDQAVILATMMKEQPGICGYDYNYFGIQSDGDWGESPFPAQFCAKDAEGVRGFASFDNMDEGIKFAENAFTSKRKDWFNKLSVLKIDGDGVKKVEVDLDEYGKELAKLWQTTWNKSLDDETFKRYKKYGYNNRLHKNKLTENEKEIAGDFVDNRGIYKKSVSDLTKEQLKIHDKYKGNLYLTPKRIESSLNSVNDLFKEAYGLIKNVSKDNEGASESPPQYNNNLDIGVPQK